MALLYVICFRIWRSPPPQFKVNWHTIWWIIECYLWQLYEFEKHKTALLEWLHENKCKGEVSANIWSWCEYWPSPFRSLLYLINTYLNWDLAYFKSHYLFYGFELQRDWSQTTILKPQCQYLEIYAESKSCWHLCIFINKNSLLTKNEIERIYHKDTEPLYHAFMYSPIILLSSIYLF